MPHNARMVTALLAALLLPPVPTPLPQTVTPAVAALEGENLSIELEELRAKSGAPGLVALAVQDGEVLAWGAAGVRAQGSDEPVDIRDPFHLGSCAKAMTATVVARLVEQDVLEWDTTIAEALPELAKDIDPGFHDVKIVELLQHRGGIAERRRPEIAALYARMIEMEGTPTEIRRQILRLVMEAPPLPPAKSGFDYSNYGYMTAGLMIETRTGKTWGTLMREQLFDPLEMQSAGVGSPAGAESPVGHVEEEGAWTPLDPGPDGFLPDAMGPAGLVHANLFDWARFVSEHMAGARDEDGLLVAASYQRLQTGPNGSPYACGWGLDRLEWSWGEGDVLTHNGSDNTWHSVVYALPQWDIVLLTGANCGGTAGQLATEQARELLMRAAGLRD